jgi:hypothetical protein
MEPRVKAGKAFRDFFIDDRPDLQAELQASVKKQFSEWLTSDEYREIREQTRQRWLTAGIDIDLHPDGESRFRVLVANANPEFLRIALDRSTVENRPPNEWFAALFASAVREQLRLNAAVRPQPTIPAEIPETPAAVEAGQGNPLKGLNADANSGQQVPAIWLSPRSVADLVQETGCSQTTINADVKRGNIPGGALRENNKPRGNVILQQTGLDYLKRKSGKDKKDQR